MVNDDAERSSDDQRPIRPNLHTTRPHRFACPSAVHPPRKRPHRGPTMARPHRGPLEVRRKRTRIRCKGRPPGITRAASHAHHARHEHGARFRRWGEVHNIHCPQTSDFLNPSPQRLCSSTCFVDQTSGQPWTTPRIRLTNREPPQTHTHTHTSNGSVGTGVRPAPSSTGGGESNRIRGGPLWAHLPDPPY